MRIKNFILSISAPMWLLYSCAKEEKIFNVKENEVDSSAGLDGNLKEEALGAGNPDKEESILGVEEESYYDYSCGSIIPKSVYFIGLRQKSESYGFTEKDFVGDQQGNCDVESIRSEMNFGGH